MSNATHADRADERHSEGQIETGNRSREAGQSSGDRLRRAARRHPVEFGLRIVAGGIGLLLILLAIEHVSRPALAAEAMALVRSAAGQWLAVAVLAVLLVLVAIRGPPE